MTQEQGDDDKEKDACNDTLQALWSEGGREGGREMGEGAQVMGEVYVNNNKINRQPQQQQTDYNDKKQQTAHKQQQQQQTDHKQQQQQQTDHKQQQQTKTSIAAVCSPVWSRCGSGL